MPSAYPHQLNGRVSDETREQMTEAINRFATNDGALVRAALEDYMPRFLANAGRPQHAELFAKLATAIEDKPELATELAQIARKSTRRRRRGRATLTLAKIT